MAANASSIHTDTHRQEVSRLDLSILRDLPYAHQSEAQKLDIYRPVQSAGPRPVILWIHPGGFHTGDKGGNCEIPLARVNMIELVWPMIARGYSVVSINYRLSQEAIFPALIYDIKAAVRWIRANAGQYGFRKEKIAAWGSSSGGYLAAMLATTGGVAELEDLSMGNAGESSRVAAAVDWFGPIDFLMMDPQHRELGRDAHVYQASSPESLLMGGAIYEIEEKCRQATPMTYVSQSSAPLYIQQGKGDLTIPYPQSIMMAEKLAAAIGSENVVLKLFEEVGHADAVFFSHENIHRILDFLDRYMR
jgi:acetyl esterase/lipase